MIFVTIGQMYGFDRLIKEMDRIAERIDEEVIMQIGDTKYEPKNAKYFRFALKEEMDRIYESSRIVVCHAGVGSIIMALEHFKPVISIPRRKEYEEVLDDHQLEIAQELEKEGKIIAVYDVWNLENILMSVSADSGVKFEKDKSLAKALREYLDELTGQFVFGEICISAK